MMKKPAHAKNANTTNTQLYTNRPALKGEKKNKFLLNTKPANKNAEKCGMRGERTEAQQSPCQ